MFVEAKTMTECQPGLSASKGDNNWPQLAAEATEKLRKAKSLEGNR